MGTIWELPVYGNIWDKYGKIWENMEKSSIFMDIKSLNGHFLVGNSGINGGLLGNTSNYSWWIFDGNLKPHFYVSNWIKTLGTLGFSTLLSATVAVFFIFQRVIDSGILSWISLSPRRMRIWTMIRCNKVKHLLLSWENPLLRSWVASWEGSVDCLGRAISTADTTEPQVKHSLETPNSESQKKKRCSQRLALTRSVRQCWK